ncbi:MAG: hypothetical protein J6U54_25360 [Clostridiales bacterium]|nr:hypothetical protein [Clostridiales bacterium]
MSVPLYCERKFYVECHECSRDDIIFPNILTGDFQETAEYGVYEYGVDTDTLKKNDFCWIILRMSVEMDSFPKWKDSFSIKTWGCGVKGIFWRRDYSVHDVDGNEIGRACSEWIVADNNSHRPVRPTNVEAVFEGKVNGKLLEPQNDRLALDYAAPKLEIPDMEELGEPVITKYADFSELDHNDHVNNTRYVAWAYDVLYKLGIDVCSIKKFDINYHSEVKSGEKVDIYHKTIDGKETIYGFKGDGVKVFAFRCK